MNTVDEPDVDRICNSDFTVSHLSAHQTELLSDERLGVKLRVTENRCVLFNPSSYVYLALLP